MFGVVAVGFIEVGCLVKYRSCFFYGGIRTRGIRLGRIDPVHHSISFEKHGLPSYSVRERTARIPWVEWDKYQSLTAAQKKLCVPILQYHKLIDGNSLLVQANAKAIVSPTPEETAKANQIMKELGVTDHVLRNFGYFQGQLRILDLDSPFAKS